MGGVLCCLSSSEDNITLGMEEYVQLVQLCQNMTNTNQVLARSNRELKRRLGEEMWRNDQLLAMASNMCDDHST
jgi:hypothetical protein